MICQWVSLNEGSHKERAQRGLAERINRCALTGLSAPEQQARRAERHDYTTRVSAGITAATSERKSTVRVSREDYTPGIGFLALLSPCDLKTS